MNPDSPACVLILNAAEGILQFVLARREQPRGAGQSPLVPLCGQSWSAPSQGAELLAPALRDALKRLHLAPADVRGIACVRGPGSFTGLRLAIATAAGLARACGALQAGLDYMPLLADNARILTGALMKQPCRIWVLTHARRQLVHMQGFILGQGAVTQNQPASETPGRDLSKPLPPEEHGRAFPSPERPSEVLSPLTGILVVSPAEAAEIIASGPDSAPGSFQIKDFAPRAGKGDLFAGGAYSDDTRPEQKGPLDAAIGQKIYCATAPQTLLVGSGLSRNRPALEEAFRSMGREDILLLPPVLDHPAFPALTGAAEQAEFAVRDIKPLYARPSDAEENLENIAASLGLDPVAARAKLDRLKAATE